MIVASKEKFKDSIRLFEMNATDMSVFNPGDFRIIIVGSAIHNIPISERQKFWGEMLRLEPKTFVFAEKIKDVDRAKHKADYDREIAAIKKVYGEKHGLKEAEEEWIRHYEYDEREAMNLDEIQKNLGNNYDFSVVSEMGLYKTVLGKNNR